jgi:hypothetical protein
MNLNIDLNIAESKKKKLMVRVTYSSQGKGSHRDEAQWGEYCIVTDSPFRLEIYGHQDSYKNQIRPICAKFDKTIGHEIGSAKWARGTIRTICQFIST